MRWTGNTRGLTLIELVAAMAVFALVAVMGLQALNGTLRLRGRLSEVERGAGDLGRGLNLLRHDMSAMVPLLFHPANGASSRSALDLSGDGRTVGFSAAGQPDLPPATGQGMHRIEWRLDPAKGQLSRRDWPVLAPARESEAHPWVAVLGGVSGMTLRSHWPQIGWVDGVSSGVADSAPEERGGDSDGVLRAMVNSYSDSLPEAIEVTLDIDGLGRITLVESLK